MPAKKPSKAKAKPVSGTEAVDALMRTLKHPHKAQVAAVRAIIMAANPKIEERVKWNAPSFFYKAADLAAFNLHNKEFAQLVLLFPRGLVKDESGVLEGEWKDRRTARFLDMKDVAAKKAAVGKIVNAWVRLMDRPG